MAANVNTVHYPPASADATSVITLSPVLARPGPSPRSRRRSTKLKPRWDVHLSGDDEQLGCAGESLSSVLGE